MIFDSNVRKFATIRLKRLNSEMNSGKFHFDESKNEGFMAITMSPKSTF